MFRKQLVAKVVFDQSMFVKKAIENLLHEGGDRAGADRRDDPAVSRKHARHRGGLSFDSALGAGGVSRYQRPGRNRQHHGAGRVWRWPSPA